MEKKEAILQRFPLILFLEVKKKKIKTRETRPGKHLCENRANAFFLFPPNVFITRWRKFLSPVCAVLFRLVVVVMVAFFNMGTLVRPRSR